MPDDDENDLLREGLEDTQKEIFDAALSNEPQAPEPEPVEEPAAEATERPRDALGRYTVAAAKAAVES